MPERMRVKIDHQGSNFSITMRVTARGQSQEQSMKYTIGAESKNEMHGAPMTSQSSWTATRW